MKKSITLLTLLMITVLGFAQSFVMINTENQQKTENLFNNSNLKIHYYNDNFVLATAKVVDESMILLDDEAFSDNDVYTLVYCPQTEQQAYLGDGEALLQTDSFVLVKGIAMPYKNDGAVAIFNKEAKLPVAHRDFPVVTEENPIIRQMMNQVNMDSLYATVQHLQDYQSRIWNSQNAFTASDWIAGRMTALGLEVEQQAFNASTWSGSGAAAPNVIGIQRGTLYPDVYVVCGSHFDSFSYEAYYGSGNAPGADDNATGVASVLESARIMTQYEFEYSIIYCAYGCEEMGLYGSEAYASRCQQQGMQILGYFNNDMNGYLNPGDPIHIDCIYPNSVAPIGDYYMNVGSVYFPNLQIRHVNFNAGDSDHTSFNNHGYMGIYPFEDYQNYSPYIHSANDLIGTSVNSWEMSQQYCRMNIGCLAEIANPTGSGPVVYCNEPINFELNQSNEMQVELSWDESLESSSGELELFDVYRNNELYVTIEKGLYSHYSFVDTVSVNHTYEYYVTAVYSDGCEASTEPITLFVDSVNEIGTEEIAFYPNPAADVIYVKGNISVCEIYDLVGKLIKTISANIDAISVKDLQSGVYMIRFITENGNVVTRKIIKK